MGDGWRVVPQALRDTQKSFDDTANRWQSLQTSVAGWKLGDGDLGLLGRAAGIIGDYNGSVDQIHTKLGTGYQSLHDASTALNGVAAEYEKQDEAYFEAFGYKEEDLDHVPPPPQVN
jgi:uncharacterized protein YukE